MERSAYILIPGAILSALAGAAACAGPYYWVGIQHPETWGIDIQFMLFVLLIGAAIGGVCAVKLAQFGQELGARAAAAWIETAGLLAGLLLGLLLGALISLALAILSMGILA